MYELLHYFNNKHWDNTNITTKCELIVINIQLPKLMNNTFSKMVVRMTSKEFDYFGNVEWFHKSVDFCMTFVKNNKYFHHVTTNSSFDITMTFVLAYNF
jgi:hypothetical protein